MLRLSSCRPRWKGSLTGKRLGQLLGQDVDKMNGDIVRSVCNC